MKLEQIDRTGAWRRWPDGSLDFLENLTTNERSILHSHWITKGHQIRECIGDDAKLIACLRRSLPPYRNGPLTIYRGENSNRFREEKIGLCWSSSVSVAEMFASGLNSVESGGLLLKAWATKESIISSPNDHSVYLDENEYTVEPKLLSCIEIVQEFPPSL